jgi:hypothetical protein
MTHAEKQTLAYSRINEQLNQIEPSNLFQHLSSSGWLHQMGYSLNEDTDLRDVIVDDMEEFMSLYYEWQSLCVIDMLEGKDEDFNEHIAEYYPNANDDTISDVANDWVDEDGFVYGAFVSYITDLYEDVIKDMQYKDFEQELENYMELAKTISGVDVEYAYYHDEYGLKIVNGVEISFPWEDENGDTKLFYAEHDDNRGWSFFEWEGDDYNSFQDMVGVIKQQIK